MVLPNPDYLTEEYFNWNGSQTSAIIITTDVGILASKRTIKWITTDVYQKAKVHEYIMGYNNRLAVPNVESAAVGSFAPGAGYQTVNCEGLIVGGDASGLVFGDIAYTASVTVNETVTNFEVTAGSTFDSLVANLNTVLPASVTAIIFEGNIDIRTTAIGVGNNISIQDGTLFRMINHYRRLDPPRVGVSTLADVFDLNFLTTGQKLSQSLIGSLQNTPNNTPNTPKTTSDIYFNHGTGTWLYTYNNVAPV